MKEVYYIKDGKIAMMTINHNADVMEYYVHENIMPVADNPGDPLMIRGNTEEVKIKLVVIGKQEFYIAARDGVEWYRIISKLATEVGEYSEAIRAGIDAIRYNEKEPKYVILSVVARNKILGTDGLGWYQPSYMNECGMDTYMQIPIAVVDSTDIIVEVV